MSHAPPPPPPPTAGPSPTPPPPPPPPGDAGARRPSRPNLLDGLLLPAWLLLGQVIGGFVAVPFFFLDGEPSTRAIVAGLIGGQIVVVGGAALWFRLRRSWPRGWFHGHRSLGRVVLLGVAATIGGFVIVQGLTALVLGVFDVEQPAEQQLFGLLDTPLGAITVIIAGVVFAPLVEEVIFRGALLDTLGTRMPSWAAIVISSVVFSAIHIETLISPVLFVGIAALGVLLAWLRVRTGSLIAPMVTHGLFNATSFTLTLTGLAE